MEEAADANELLLLEAKNSRRFDYVRFVFSDLNGIPRISVVPRRYVERNISQGFATFSGLNTIGSKGTVLFQDEMKELKFSNLQYISCKGTLRNCEWVKLSTKDKSKDKDEWQVGSLIVEMQWPKHFKGGQRAAVCSRVALRRQLGQLAHYGYSLKSAFEVEFTLFQADGRQPAFDVKNQFAGQSHAKFENYLYTIERYMEKAGVNISDLRVEHGQGQFELVMESTFDINASDDTVRLKQAVKEISASLGYVASFMTLPYEKLSSNGFHLNLSLWKREGKHAPLTNAFYDEDDPDNMSAVMRHFLAGLLKHAKALTAFASPTVNCYRRMHTPFAPHKIDWAVDNRVVAFRVKSGGHSSTYIENRLNSAACNPYLATAATIAAGLDGISKKLPLQERNNDDLNADTCFKIDSSDPDARNYLPYTLQEALGALEEDEVLKEALGEDLVRWFVTLKRKSEIDFFTDLDEEQVWEKERDLYFEFI